MGTAVNIELLLQKLRKSKRRDGLCCVFIDFRSAYNTIDRMRLYQMLLEKNILLLDEVRFLKSLHDRLYFEDESH
jgi:predicted AAA+ superfamily ATPase